VFVFGQLLSAIDAVVHRMIGGAIAFRSQGFYKGDRAKLVFEVNAKVMAYSNPQPHLS
jgi:hypothetical protein